MDQMKPSQHLLSAALIFVMAGLFTANLFTGYFRLLDPLLSGIMAAGFAVCALAELSNYFKARREEKESQEGTEDRKENKKKHKGGKRK